MASHDFKIDIPAGNLSKICRWYVLLIMVVFRSFPMPSFHSFPKKALQFSVPASIFMIPLCFCSNSCPLAAQDGSDSEQGSATVEDRKVNAARRRRVAMLQMLKECYNVPAKRNSLSQGSGDKLITSERGDMVGINGSPQKLDCSVPKNDHMTHLRAKTGTVSQRT